MKSLNERAHALTTYIDNTQKDDKFRLIREKKDKYEKLFVNVLTNRRKRFNSLQEELLTEEVGLGNDTTGKLHEILVAKHLHPAKEFPQHFRDPETQLTPEALHDKLKSQLTPEQYAHHDEKAKYAASAILNHLHERGHINDHGHITHATWTSNPKDLHHLTQGAGDPANPSDIVLHHASGHMTGISLKVGNKKKPPNLGNHGVDKLDKAFKVDTKGIRNAAKEKNYQLAREHGIDVDNVKKSHMRKLEKETPGLESKTREVMNKSSVETANHYREALKQKKPHELAGVLRNLAQAKPTKINYYRMQTYGMDGKFSHEIVQPHEEIEGILKNHAEHLHVKPGKGTTVTFGGKDGAAIARLTVKGSRGGFQGHVATLQGFMAGAKEKAPKEPKPKKTKKAAAPTSLKEEVLKMFLNK